MPRTYKKKTEKLVTFEDGLQELINTLDNRQSINTGSFWEFTRDIWSQGYEHKSYFDAWHVGVICEDVDRALSEGKGYVAILPRGHLKSTILGYAFCVWLILNSEQDSSILYLSYSDGMSRYHISEMNRHIRRNSQLMEWMTDRSPNADYSFRYMVNGFRAEVAHGGLFSFKRGMHLNGALICDDLMRDPENPLNISTLSKIEEWFYTETLYIPNRGVPVIVLGTPMLPGDLLFKLQGDERFLSRVLPALDPIPGRRVLMPELYTEAELLHQKQIRPKSFASEMMLTPYLSTESYLNDEDIGKCENDKLESLNPYTKHDIEADFVFAGFDVGKKRHPSHLAIFKIKDKIITQIHQAFLDSWDYTEQISHLNLIAENFDLDRAYVDNTRGELEERGLKSIWNPLTFTLKQKRKMAQVFEEYVNSGRLQLIADERQRSQITCVNNELKAPETPLGHGDSFFSIAMALLACYEQETSSTTLIGDMNDFTPKRNENSLEPKFDGEYNSDSNEETCPDCGSKNAWISANSLCLTCYAGSLSLKGTPDLGKPNEEKINFPL